MILIALRILLGTALGYTIYEAWKNGQTNLEHGDLLNAYYVAVCVGLAILNAIVWAPFVGAKLSDPLTGAITNSTYVERYNYLLRFIRWLDNRRWRGPTRWMCFVEGIRHPSQPTQFIIGLNNSRPDSWLEKVFALEVFRFHNIQNCVQAYHVLRRHGLDPRPHTNHEVNIVLMSLEREVRPTPEVLALPKRENLVRPTRNAKIRLFDGASGTTLADPATIERTPPDRHTPPVGNGVTNAQVDPTRPPDYPAWWQVWWRRIWRFIETH